jgi:hypothetical protein
MKVEELERALAVRLNEGALTVEPALLAEFNLPAIPFLLDLSAPILLTSVNMARTVEDELTIDGELILPQLGQAALEVVLRDSTAGLASDVHWNFPDLDLRRLAEMFGWLTPPIFLDLKVEAIDLIEVAGVRALSLSLDGVRSLRLGPIEGKLTAENLVFALTMKVLEVKAELAINGRGFPIQFADDKLAIDASGLDLRGLLDLLGIAVPPIPPLPLLSEPLDQVKVAELDGDWRLWGRFRAGDLGYVRFAAGDNGGELAGAIALDTPEDLRPGQLHSVLSPLDVLADVVAFDTPALTMATADLASWPISDGRGGSQRIDLPKGLAVHGELLLDDFGLDFVKALIGVEALPFDIPLPVDPAAVRLVAHVDRRVPIIPGVLLVDDFKVSVSPNPLVIIAAGSAELSLFGMTLPRLRLGSTLAAGTYSFFLAAEEPWERPLGLPFTIEEVGLQIDGPVVAYGFFGTIALRNRRFAVAGKFVGQAPVMLDAQLDGDLSMVGLLEDLTGLKLPFLFEPKLSDAALYIVLDPRGTTIGERLYPRGIGLSGSLTFLGLGGRIKLHGDGIRLQAEGELNGPIRIKPLLEITGVDGEGAPSFALDTSGDPILRLRGRASILGLTQEISADVGSRSVSFALQQSAGLVRADLRAELGEGTFAASGTTSCRISGSIGPIKLAGVDLGKLKLDAGVSCHTEIKANGTDDAHVRVSASFKFSGLSIDLPSLDLDIDTLEKLPEKILHYVIEHAEVIFAELFSSVDKWLAALAHGLIEGVEDVAGALSRYFKQTIEDVARALRTTLANGIKETIAAIEKAGETVEQAAKALVAIGEAPEAVANALKDLGRSADEIGKVLRVLDRPQEEIQRILTNVVGKDAAEAAIIILFPIPIRIPNPGDIIPDVRIRLPVRLPRVRF